MLGNITDIHSHSLWDIDDGAGNFDESVDMCFEAEESGTKTLFVTPHLMYWNQAEALYDEREEKVDILCECLEDHDSSLVIKKALKFFVMMKFSTLIISSPIPYVIPDIF